MSGTIVEFRKELLDRLRDLESLNPDLTRTEQERLDFLAENVGRECFDQVAAQVNKLCALYLGSPVKQSGIAIMEEYFHLLENSAKMLREAGVVTKALPTATDASFSTALVPREKTEALDFCRILNRSELPKPLVKAADAFRRRNLILDTVFGIALRILWKIDAMRTERWIYDYFSSKDGNLDPDIVRDALSTALAINHRFETDTLKFVMNFASDANLLEYWPMVVQYADRTLERSALYRWFAANPARNALLFELKLYVDKQRLDDETLLAWSRKSLAEIGLYVQRFMELDGQEQDEQWRSMALYSELKRISGIFKPVLLLADQMLSLPDGTDQLAMAFMGLAGIARDNWEKSLRTYATRAVRMTFLLDMKAHRKPLDTIRKLTFGDEKAFNWVYGQLDLASENFDSIKQRELVTKFLAEFYASFRRSQLLGYEVAKRYRNLMRLMHDDFLGQHLTSEQMEAIHAQGILMEYSTIAAEARKYLAKRKADENSLEQMLAAKIAFERFVRDKRIEVIRSLIN